MYKKLAYTGIGTASAEICCMKTRLHLSLPIIKLVQVTKILYMGCCVSGDLLIKTVFVLIWIP